MTIIKKAITAVCFIIIGAFAFRPHPKISANSCGVVCAHCPRGFKNNVMWRTFQDDTTNQQWAQYVNDAAGGYCSVDWKWVATGRSSY